MRGATLTRRVAFTAAHRYHRPEWSDLENQATFGACASPDPHVHDYVCDVTVAGEVDHATGMVMDLGAFDRILADEVVTPLNGRVVNDSFDEFRPGGLIPTCEELARIIAARVGSALASAGARAHVMTVRVGEDDRLSASWTAGE